MDITLRAEIYAAIDRERAYQTRKWGTIADHPHEVGGYLLIAKKELDEAIEAWVKARDGDAGALRELLQVVAVGVACMEQHGVVERSQPAEPATPAHPLFESLARERVEAAQQLAALPDDQCQLCEATGPDKRSLVLDCFYRVDEVIPEAIDLHAAEDAGLRGRGWYLRICKGCRGRLLAALGAWRQECIALREVAKDSDGTPEDDNPARTIPVRQHGAIVLMTREEYEAYQRLRQQL